VLIEGTSKNASTFELLLEFLAIFEIISGLFSRLTHPTSQNKTLKLITYDFTFIFDILTLISRISYFDFDFNSSSDIDT